MKKLVILGGGTAGTMMAAKLRERLDPWSWQIQVVDRDDRHVYQPGLLFLPFGIYNRRHLHKPRRRFIPDGVELVLGEVDRIEPERNRVTFADGGHLPYDQLIVATGSRIVPEETPGLAEDGWGRDIFDFYTVRGASALRDRLAGFKGGRVLVNLVDMPVKCPVAPLEFAFLADWFFHERGVRDDVELVYATSLDSAFTKKRCSDALAHVLEEKGIRVEASVAVERVDGRNRVLHSFDGRTLDFDLLVSVPLHRGSPVVARSGLGNEADFIPTDKHSLRSLAWENIWVLGDATDLPSSKAGSVAHFQAEVLTENLEAVVSGLEPPAAFDGHANCFIETGFGKAILIDFNYDTEPLPGRFPLPGAGPFTLLEESEANHWGKMAFRWAYWNLLLKGADMSSIGPSMSMAGKWSCTMSAATQVTSGNGRSSPAWEPTVPGPEGPRGRSEDLAALHDKIDRLTATVDRLDRRREELEELVEDLMPAVNGALLLARDRLDRLERTGAWGNGAEALSALETALAGMDPDDLRALARAAPDLVRTARTLAAPEITELAPRLVAAMHDAEHGPAPTFRSLLKQARAPRIRRGMGVALSLLRGLGRGTGHHPAPARAPAPSPVRTARPPSDCQMPAPRAPRPSGSSTASPAPGTLEVDGQALALDGDGNLHDPGDWAPGVAEAFAARSGLELTGRHWEVLEFVREDGAASGAAPGIRRIVAETGVSQKELYGLFPGGPAVLAARLSGLKKPKSCV